MSNRVRWGWLVLILFLALPGAAFAQATRTWVSGVGDDVNPCSRTAPCKTFAGAFPKTAAGGVINALDPGAYGAVTITKALTIESDGDFAGIIVSGTNAIIINASSTDTVTLRGLSIEGLGTGLAAVRLLQARQLVAERVNIESFTGPGFELQPATATTVTLRDVTIQSSGTGVTMLPSAGGSLSVTLDNVRMSGNGTGIAATGPGVLTMRGGSIVSSTGSGVTASGGANSVTVSLQGVTIADSINNGVLSQNAGAIVRLTDSEITGNAQGLLATGGGQILSFGDNRVIGNVVNGTPTSTVTSQ